MRGIDVCGAAGKNESVERFDELTELPFRQLKRYGHRLGASLAKGRQILFNLLGLACNLFILSAIWDADARGVAGRGNHRVAILSSRACDGNRWGHAANPRRMRVWHRDTIWPPAACATCWQARLSDRARRLA